MEYYMSIYSPGELSEQCIIDNIKKLKIAFPDTTDDSFEALIDGVRARHFSDQRFTDAVDFVINKQKLNILRAFHIIKEN